MGGLARVAPILQKFQAGAAYRLGRSQTLAMGAVKRHHPAARRLILHRPQAHDQGGDTRYLESPA